MDTQKSLIPFALIKSLAKIENIFEMRLFGWVLAKAQASLKLANPNLADVNLQYALNLVRVTIPARYLLADGDRNYKNIMKAFTLANKTIAYEKEGSVYHLNIIAMPSLLKGADGRLSVSFVIHNEIWHAILNNFRQGYRLFDLATFLRLKSNYSVILYLLISNQKTCCTFSLDHLRKMLGADTKAYDRTSNFIARVIEPARKELNEAAPWTYDYDVERGGRGGGYNAIVLRPRANCPAEPSELAEAIARDRMRADERVKVSEAIALERLRLDERVSDYLSTKFAMEPREIERLEARVLALGDWSQQIDRLAYIFDASRRHNARNPRAYLYASLRGG